MPIWTTGVLASVRLVRALSTHQVSSSCACGLVVLSFYAEQFECSSISGTVPYEQWTATLTDLERPRGPTGGGASLAAAYLMQVLQPWTQNKQYSPALSIPSRLALIPAAAPLSPYAPAARINTSTGLA